MINNQIKKYKRLIIFILAILFFTHGILFVENRNQPVMQPAPGSAPEFKQILAGSARKAAFLDYFAPLIHKANRETLRQRAQIQEWAKSPAKNQDLLTHLANDYRLTPFNPLKLSDINALLQRVDTIPTSLALAQAANESAWGTSRFARQANNYFGQWCFTKGCGLVPKQRNEGAIHEVRSFARPYKSIKSYLHNLNSHRSYQTLRDIRFRLKQNNQPVTGIALAQGLTNYSSRKQQYVKELQAMIRYNKLQKYDLN